MRTTHCTGHKDEMINFVSFSFFSRRMQQAELIDYNISLIGALVQNFSVTDRCMWRGHNHIYFLWLDQQASRLCTQVLLGCHVFFGFDFSSIFPSLSSCHHSVIYHFFCLRFILAFRKGWGWGLCWV